MPSGRRGRHADGGMAVATTVLVVLAACGNDSDADRHSLRDGGRGHPVPIELP